MRLLDFVTRAIRRTMLPLGCVAALAACTTWVAAPPPGPSALKEISGPIRIIRPDGFSVVLRDAYVTGDTLYGYPAESVTGARMAVPLRDVVSAHRREVDPLRSLGAAAVGAAAAFGGFVLMMIYAYSGAST